MSQWDNDELNARLRSLHDDGIAYSTIAEKLNEEFGTEFTRSSCIGRAYRLKLAKREPSGPKPRAPRQSKPRVRGIDGALVRKLIAKVTEPTVLDVQPIIDADIPVEQRKTLLELTSETCRWPIGEGADLFFCGAEPLTGHPYCLAHCRRAYTVEPRISERDRERRRLHCLRLGKRWFAAGDPTFVTAAAAAQEDAA